MRYIFLLAMLQIPSFKENQVRQPRVMLAYQQKELTVQQYFKNKKMSETGFHLFLRAFKKEQQLEIWIREQNSDQYSYLHTYSFCTTSGTLGPKRKEGDLQIPEGVYHINHFNPQSNFYLSLGLNYPNNSDKILSDKQRPGGSIYIHGSCVTIGCIPITDEKIKELYVLAVEARNNGQEKIPVHIFPTRLTNDALSILKTDYRNSGHFEFWENLKTVFDDFEQTKKLRTLKVDRAGRYQF
jgi:murein L,D-transpeptidase YafK